MDSFLFLDFSDSMRWQPFSFHSPNQTNQQRAELMLFPTQKKNATRPFASSRSSSLNFFY
jgi:hypothetical protein